MGLSKQQKTILALAASREAVAVRDLYNPKAKNLRSVQASVSRAISRLQERGLIECLSVSEGERNVPAIRIKAEKS